MKAHQLWQLGIKDMKGHEGRYTIYVHASREKPEHVSPLFMGRDIHSEKVVWGKISMVDAERRLLSNALEDIDNQHFVLLSDSCVPFHNFDYVYDYLIGTNISFIDSFYDPGPHGNFRYSKNMLPEVRESDFRKGSQWFSVKRQHALMIIADSLYYTKFKLYCKPGMEDGRNCYADEHYLPTLFHMMDPNGISNWSVTHVDWSEGKWHPKAYRANDVTYELLKNITSIDMSYHITSDSKVKGTDRGVLLPKDGHQEVADVALQLAKYCIDDPVKSPLIFGEWEVVYCSVPTSPGGLYRTPLGRLIFKTDEMVQVVEAPDVVRNKVSFSVFGFDGVVSLKGNLNVLDGKWIQVIFEPPEVKRAMPMRVLTVGKKRSRGTQLILEEYKDKLGYYCDIEDVLIKSNPKLTSDVNVQVEAEDVAIMLQLKPEDFVVVLDENGKDITSEQVADLVGDAGNTVVEHCRHSGQLVEHGSLGELEPVEDEHLLLAAAILVKV
ncbi:hypothetical protein E2562_034881 [Oryza meyeriana var. granulata]|uniref:Plastid lipid-associated protein/fibrillin conserved domain-containing protein n=1 Tax=Oryza meyeriana var. granulata TaxID=110450 RepID=A0A6G1C0I4_9ORYZ|nr:hypothetical protein E2562_034881 [Oryza meyeriana var. granulata]